MVNKQKIKFAKTIFLCSMILLGLTLASGKMWESTPVSSYSLSNGNKQTISGLLMGLKLPISRALITNIGDVNYGFQIGILRIVS